MPTRNASNVSFDTEKRNLEKVFNSLVQMIKNQQTQIETLVTERKLLQDRIRTMHDGWSSDIRMYRGQISEIQGALMYEEKKRMLEVAKADFVLGSKRREAYITQLILGHTESEMADFKEAFEYLALKVAEGKDPCERIAGETGSKNESDRDGEMKSSTYSEEENKRAKVLEAELIKLKRDYEKLDSEKNSEVSTLLAEKKFVWNQFDILDKNYCDKLKVRNSELEHANKKIEMLVSSMEQLNSSKDDAILRLEGKVADVEVDRDKLSEENSRLSLELELLKQSRSTDATPILKRCTSRNKDSVDKNCNKGRSNITVKKESSHDSGKVGSSSKRKNAEVIPISETPTLFTSRFKVPKLKNSPACKR